MGVNDWTLPEVGTSGPTDWSKIYPQFSKTGAAPAGQQPPAVVASDEPQKDYANTSWTDVAGNALHAMPGSIVNAGEGLWNTVRHPLDTLNTVGEIESGLASKTGIQSLQDPQAEALVNSIGKHYSDTYGSVPGFKKTMSEDPMGPLMDLASVVPGVGEAGVASKAAKVAKMADPIQGAIGIGKIARTMAAPVEAGARYASGVASGVPQSVLKIAEDAGRTGTDAQKATFKEFAMGNGDPAQMAQAAQNAVTELRDKASVDYTANKQNLVKDPLPLNMIEDAFQAARDKLDPHGLGLNSAAIKDLNGMQQQFDNVKNATNPAARSAEGLDRLKRSLSEDFIAPYRGSGQSGALNGVVQAVRDTISHADKSYADMMDGWQKWREELANLKDAGATGNASETRRVIRLLSMAKKGDSPILSRLAQTQAGHTLPQMLAGHTVKEWAPNYMRGAGLGALAYLAAPTPAAGIGAAMLASPRLAGLTSYGMGRVGAGVDAIGKSVPSYAGNVASQLGNAGQAGGFRRGGAVLDAADRLVMAAERAKGDLGKSTEPLLEQPDDHIVKALEVANRSI